MTGRDTRGGPPTVPAAAEQLSRLLALVPWLSAHDGVTVAEAAEHFGVTPDQLERDLWLLVVTGLPGHLPDQLVDIQFWDDGGRIHVLDPQTLGRPLRLSPDEAMALLVGLRLLAQVPGDHDRAALASATATLERAAGDAAHGSARVQVSVESPDVASGPVEQAVRERRALRLRYLGGARDEVTERVVDPLRILVVGDRPYLVGWCRRAGAVRTFRLDRVLHAEVLAEPAAPPPDAAVRSVEPGGLRPEDATVVTVELRPEARWAADQPAALSAEETPDGSLRVRFAVGDPAWIVGQALRWGGAGRVVAPPEVVTAVRDAAEAALAGYGDPPDG
ncbi:MAG: WYL domain-containing protein [Candidatus Nanopelagicales bacterium]